MPAKDHDVRYFNRELSWLDFNSRVLEEARDNSNPLLERLKFLAITATNLDEFFMVRVGGLQSLAKQGKSSRDPAGLTPAGQLRAISQLTHRFTAEQYSCLLEELEPALAEAGIRRIVPAGISDRHANMLESLFDDEIFSVLSPQATPEDSEFPPLGNLMLHVCVHLKPDGDDEPRFAIIPMGKVISRFVTLPSEGGYDYMLLEDVVRHFAGRFFPGEEIVECVPFRITRNADMSIREDMAQDLLAGMEEILDARKQSDCVRLEISDQVTMRTLRFLQKSLDVSKRNIYATPGPLDLSSFMRLCGLGGFDDLQNEPWPPQPSPQIDPAKTLFETIAERDVLLYHPYESFEPIVRMLEEAAVDPDVLAIKQILYRTSRNSPIVAALARAAENDKYVTVVVELKARFDEARNIEWAKSLEHSGVQVIYGVKGLKTHAKLCVIARREPHGVARYVHIGTGNYNESTARLYSDASLLTCNEDLGADAVNFFNSITGYSQPQRLRKLHAAPLNLRDAVVELIRNEASRKTHGQRASIMAKVNSLVDTEVIEALYEASQAGVKIQLNVRGICCLRPGVQGLSDNITVVSVVDRFLEHARILYFRHGGDDQVFLSSADWMPRNLDRRVELLAPVEDPSCRDRLISILETYFKDTSKAHKLMPDGSYRRVKPTGRRKLFRSQEALYREACEATERSRKSQAAMFEPHRAPSKES